MSQLDDERAWTVREALRSSTHLLKETNISETPRLDAEILLCHLLHCKPIDLIRRDDVLLTAEQKQTLVEWLRRRLHHEPIAYIVGEQEFYGRVFKVSPAVLIPRPDTELLIERVLHELQGVLEPTIVDLGAGSGCIAVTLQCEIPRAQVIAVEWDESALAVAKENAQLNAASVRFVQGDMLSDALWGQLPFCDVLVSNPPYIALSEKPELSAGVVEFEPHIALFAPTGLEFYKAIAQNAAKCVKSNGKIFVEIGFAQKDDVTRIFHAAGFSHTEVFYDLSGHPRVVMASRS